MTDTVRQAIREAFNLGIAEAVKMCGVVEDDCRKEAAAGDLLAKLAYGSAGDTAKRLARAIGTLKMDVQ